MAGAPVGANVGIYLDCREGLDVGDLVVTRTRRCYRVTSVRVQQRGRHVGRQHLRVDVVDYDEAIENVEDEKVIEMWWYARR